MRETDGVVNIMEPQVGLKPDGILPLQCSWHVRLLVQWIPTGHEGVWGLGWVVRVASGFYEWMLIWVPVPDTGGVAPGSLRRWCAWRHSASQAAFAAFSLVYGSCELLLPPLYADLLRHLRL